MAYTCVVNPLCPETPIASRFTLLFDRSPPGNEGDVSDHRYEEGPNESRNEGFGDNERKKGREKVSNRANQPQDRDDDKSLDDAQREDNSPLEKRAFYVEPVPDENG